MFFKEGIAKYTLGLLTNKDLPDIAMAALEEGYDSEWLRILAGYPEAGNSSLLVDYWGRVLRELAIPAMSTKEACIVLILQYIDAVNNGQCDAYDGFADIECMINKTGFYYKDLDLGNCYGIYLDMEQLKIGYLHLPEGRNEGEYEEELRCQLNAALLQWYVNVHLIQ